MKESEIVRKNEEYPVHYEVLSSVSLLFSRSGKNRNTEVIAREKSRKKRPYVTRICVLHKVKFLIFSWFISGYHILPFWKKLMMRGVTLKYLISFPLNSAYGLGGEV